MRRFLITLLLLLSIGILLHSIQGNTTEKIRWGYIAHYSLTTGVKVDDILRRSADYTHIGITGFPADSNGNIYTPIPSPVLKKVISQLKDTGKTLIPVIGLKSLKDGHKILDSTGTRNRLIRSIKKVQEEMDTHHVQFDWEYLPPAKVDAYAGFLRTVKSELENSRVSAAVFPQVDFPHKWAGFHDLSKIGEHLDYIVLMCYDLHRKGTEPGPVVTIEWTKKNIKKALEYMESEDILLGVPSYGYRWCGKGDTKKITALSARYVERLGRQYGFVRHPSGNLLVAYDNCKIFASDNEMITSLQKIASEFNLAGTALWRIGFEE